MQVLAEIPAGSIWGLPFLTVLAPRSGTTWSAAVGTRRSDWGRQMIRQLRRWLPDRELVVADSTYAALELLADAAGPAVTVVTRLRLDAALYDPAPLARTRDHGATTGQRERQPTLAQRLLDPGHRLGDADRPLVWWQDRPVDVATVPPSGTTLVSRPSRCAGCCCAIRPARPSEALLSTDQTVGPVQIVACSSPAGRWKSPSTKSALISASRPSGNGRTSPSCARPQLCSASSRS